VHIAINAHLLSDHAGYRSAGVSNYSRHLLTALGQVAVASSDLRLTAFAHARSFAASGVTVRWGSPRLEHPLWRIAWEQTALPWELIALRAHVVHGLVNVLPLTARCPGVVTVHDLSFVRLPQSFKPVKRAYLTALCRASVGRAAQVLAVSRQTADDLTSLWGVEPTRIHVAPNGVDGRFAPAPPDLVAAWRAAQGLPERYWLFVGTLEPRKNLGLLLEAFARWRQDAGAAGAALQLILAGGQGWYYEAIYARVAELGLTDVVRFPGFVPDADLPNWYRGAELFIFPSRYEGFGLPALEAMACGTPVLCSDAPGVREVAGAAARQVPVDDVAAWTAALAQLADSPALRRELAAAGVAHAARFSWEHAAAVTVDAYARAAAHAR
jgi:glycosyltransferase involved in cell wall biosynthesis